MLKTIETYPYLTITFLVLIMLLPGLNDLQVTIMEARNFITAREMIQDNNWLLTTMNGEPRYQKPPLPTWFSAISAMLFGVKSIFAMRLPAVLMLILIGIFIHKLSLKLSLPDDHALVNALIVITSFYVLGIIIEAPWDIYTHGFMLMGIYYLTSLFLSSESIWKNTLFAGLFIGCSLLSKGPISLYGLFFPFLIAFGFSYRYQQLKLKFPYLMVVFIVALAVGGWWYLYVKIFDSDTLHVIAAKETGNWSSYNVKPFYYYWSFFTQSGLWTLPAFISLLYFYLKRKVGNKKSYKLTFLWTIISVVLLSIIPEKKPRYLMPVLIPLALNTGFYIYYLIQNFKNLKQKIDTWPVYFNFGLISVIGVVAPIGTYILFKENLISNWFLFALFSIVQLLFSIVIFRNLIKKDMKNAFYSTVAYFIVTCAFGIPLSKAFLSESYKPIHELRSILEKENLPVYSYNTTPETIWQYGSKIPAVSNNTFLSDKAFFLISPNTIDELNPIIPNHVFIKKVDEYNLNPGKKQKQRLISYVYLIKTPSN